MIAEAKVRTKGGLNFYVKMGSLGMYRVHGGITSCIVASLYRILLCLDVISFNQMSRLSDRYPPRRLMRTLNIILSILGLVWGQVNSSVSA